MIHDIRKPLPFPDNSAAALYGSHVLEHLYREEGQQLIAESFRVLGAGGVLRIVVPDLRAIVEEYLRNAAALAESCASGDLRPADRMNQRLLVHWPTPISSHLLYRVYSSWQDFHSHKWMYDADSISTLFKRAGFIDVERRDCYDSRITDIRDVEDESRILNGEGVCVVGVKPVC